MQIKDENLTESSYTVKLKYIGPLHYPNSIKIDISLREKPVLPLVFQRVKHIIVLQKCTNIGIRFGVEHIFRNQETLKRIWKQDLVELIPEVPEFEVVVKDLKIFIDHWSLNVV